MSNSTTFQSVLATTGEQPVDHMKHIVNRDRDRAQKFMQGMQPHGPLFVHELRKKGHHGASSGDKTTPGSQQGTTIDVTDSAVTYVTSVGKSSIGKPSQKFNLLIDTGSSNTWVGASQEYKPTSTSQTQRQEVSVSYGSGSFSGTEYTDTVALSSSMVIQKQSIGVANQTQGFGNDGIDGILGIGPVDLTRGTVDGMPSVPTVTDNLVKEGIIKQESIGIFYAPTPADSKDLANGEMTFGGVDETKITAPVKYVPITKTSPANKYWGIDQSIQYNGKTIMNNNAGIVDTGTTLIMLASDTFEKYQQATGAVMDKQFKNMKNMEFHIGGTVYELTPNAQIWPRALNATLGGHANKIYLVFADMGQPSGTGLDFINGFAFLQRFYSAYDTTNSQIGFAETKFTRAETN
ncbi:hypothetical protein V5O48_007020 [Marasmius crinis-equi]|uniref:Peptidase A1 domain-containing protein n=1 Tax=Marasmius crinis-equi TaxID=585013 RepID=A0ABR3FHV2_9AGAR